MTRLALVVLLACVAAVAAPVPKGVKAKAPNLDGRWEAVEMTVGQQDVLNINRWVWHVKGEELQGFERGKGGRVPMAPGCTLSLVAPEGGGPNDFDYRCEGNGVSSSYPALVEVTDDEFRISFPTLPTQPRPTEVKAGEGVQYIRFKRVTDK